MEDKRWIHELAETRNSRIATQAQQRTLESRRAEIIDGRFPDYWRELKASAKEAVAAFNAAANDSPLRFEDVGSHQFLVSTSRGYPAASLLCELKPAARSLSYRFHVIQNSGASPKESEGTMSFEADDNCKVYLRGDSDLYSPEDTCRELLTGLVSRI